jgi:hypothetical protein
MLMVKNDTYLPSTYVNFIIMDFKGTYRAILGRLALAKFMAVPHYVYLLLKMPTEKGVLNLRGNVSLPTHARKRVSPPPRPSSSRSACRSPSPIPRRLLWWS